MRRSGFHLPHLLTHLVVLLPVLKDGPIELGMKPFKREDDRSNGFCAGLCCFMVISFAVCCDHSNCLWRLGHNAVLLRH